MSPSITAVPTAKVRFGAVILGSPSWSQEKQGVPPEYAYLPVTLTGVDTKYNPHKAMGDSFTIISSDTTRKQIGLLVKYPDGKDLPNGADVKTLPTDIFPLMKRIVKGPNNRDWWFNTPKRNIAQEKADFLVGNPSLPDSVHDDLDKLFRALPWVQFKGPSHPGYYKDLPTTVNYFAQASSNGKLRLS